MDKIFKKYKTLLFVDVETTGLDPFNDRIIEIGIVKVDKDNNLTQYSKLVNPGFKINKEVRTLTGIKIKDLQTASTFEQISKDLLSFFKADIFIAHNVRFDYEFLAQEFLRINLEAPIAFVDSIKLAKAFYPNYLTYSLDSIIARLRLSVKKRHRGLDDAQVLWQLYQKLVIDFGELAVYQTINKLAIFPPKRKIEDKTQVSLL